jgi:hypothetical protein
MQPESPTKVMEKTSITSNRLVRAEALQKATSGLSRLHLIALSLGMLMGALKAKRQNERKRNESTELQG